MDHIKNFIDGNKDLFIPVGNSSSGKTSQNSTRKASADDADSAQTTASTSSTAPTADVEEADSRRGSITRTRRYTITASQKARPPTETNLQQKSTDSLRKESIGAGNTGATLETTPSTQATGGTKPGRSHGDSTLPSNQVTGRRNRPSEDGSTEDPGKGTGTAAPSIRPKYPPTSYRGPVGHAETVSTKPTRFIPPPLKQDATVPLTFGKLTLDQMSKAIDAPPSPHKPSGISRLVRRLSGKRRSTPSTPTTPTRPRPMTPTKPLPDVPQVPLNASSSSIPSAPTPYTSPDPSPSPSRSLGKSKSLRSRRRTLTTSPEATPNSSQTSNLSRSRSTTATKSTLPDPESVYANTSFFTTCPHTSPPSHRPINIQPTLTTFTPTLLTYPPFHLRARIAANQPIAPISVIVGSCSDCDYRARRQQEGEVLAKYADIRNSLLGRIKGLRQRMAALHPPDDSDDPDGEGGKKLRGTGDAVEDEQDLELEMLAVEGEIEELPERQEGDVKRVWRGWASKWGPGTIGIHRAPDLDADESSEGLTSSDVEGSASSASRGGCLGLNRWGGKYDNVVKDGRMKLDWIRPDLP
jgi:hypothetical protein